MHFRLQLILRSGLVTVRQHRLAIPQLFGQGDHLRPVFDTVHH